MRILFYSLYPCPKARRTSILMALLWSIAAYAVSAVSTASAADLPTFKIKMENGHISPQKLEVPAGVRLRLEVENASKGAAEFESVELKKELVLAPGITRTLVLNPLRPGSYRFFDDFNQSAPPAYLIAK